MFALLAACPLLVHAQAVASIANTPTFGQCPAGFSLVRQAGPLPKQNLNPSELAYVQSRTANVLPNAWKSYLTNIQQTNIGLPSYVHDILSGNSKDTPNLGIAASGGGYRAAIFGAGVTNALDGRNASAAKIGTGGLLQAATYLSGLSGGAWLINSLVQANFPLIEQVVFGLNSPNAYAGWLTEFGITAPTNNTTQNQQFILELITEVKGKHDAGFDVTIVDLWARALARHFLNGTTLATFLDATTAHGAGITLSGLANM